MKISSPAKIVAESRAKIFIYGPPGDGKTTLLSSYPEDTLYIAVPPSEVISVLKHKDRAFMPVAECYTLEDCKEAVAEGTRTHKKLVVFDSTTKLRELCVEEAKKQVKGPVSKATWTQGNVIFFEVLRPLINDTKHDVILVGHHRKITDEVTKKVEMTADHGEGLLRQLIPDMHATFYYRKEGGVGISQKRMLYTTSIPGIELKNRYDLPSEFKDPTLDDIFNAVEKYREAAAILIAEREAGNDSKIGD